MGTLPTYVWTLNREVLPKKSSNRPPNLKALKTTRRAQTLFALRCSASPQCRKWHRQFQSLCFLVAAHCHRKRWRRRKRRLPSLGLLLKSNPVILKQKALAKVIFLKHSFDPIAGLLVGDYASRLNARLMGPYTFDCTGYEWFPRMDVVESGSVYVVTVELPGVNVDGICCEVTSDR